MKRVAKKKYYRAEERVAAHACHMGVMWSTSDMAERKGQKVSDIRLYIEKTCTITTFHSLLLDN